MKYRISTEFGDAEVEIQGNPEASRIIEELLKIGCEIKGMRKV